MKSGDERAERGGDREVSLRPAARECINLRPATKENIISVFLIVHSLYPIIRVLLPEISFRKTRAYKRIPHLRAEFGINSENR